MKIDIIKLTICLYLFLNWPAYAADAINSPSFSQLLIRAESGNSDAQFNVGTAYYNGNGTKQDVTEALKWFHHAAENGQSDAETMLGVLYDHGRDVPINYAEALKWYRKSCRRT